MASLRATARLGRDIKPRHPPARIWAAVRGVSAAAAIDGDLPGDNPVFPPDDADEGPALPVPTLPFAALSNQIDQFNSWVAKARAHRQPVAILDFYRYLGFLQESGGVDPGSWGDLRSLKQLFYLPEGWPQAFDQQSGSNYYYSAGGALQWERPRL